MSSDASSILAAADRLEASARRGRPLVVIGMIAIIAGFALLTLFLGQQSEAYKNLADRNALAAARWHAEAARWKAGSDAVTQTNADTREAAAAGDWPKVRRLLNIADSEAQDLQKAAAQAVSATVAPPRTSATSLAPVADAPSGARAQLVYIQFAGFQRETIAALNKKLRDAGWNTQSASGERLEVAAGRHEVRFHGDADAAAAAALADAVGQALGRTVKPQQMATIVPGTLELWISQ